MTGGPRPARLLAARRGCSSPANGCGASLRRISFPRSAVMPDSRSRQGHQRVHEQWAHLRFAVVGWLLAAPPEKGELRAAITDLAKRTWEHPTTREPVRFGFSTIERWYYRAVAERTDPVGVLRRKVRCNAGQQHTVSDAVRRAVLAQYAAHKGWSVQLHHDNLVALAETQPDLKPVPSYPTLRRFMRANGLDKRRRLTPRTTRGAEMGDLFSVELRPANRWGGAKLLRDRWQTHIDAALSRPVLIIDEAQEMLPAVLADLRLLSSAKLDSHILLTVVLAGDGRLLERLRSDELMPLNSRMRVRLALERSTPDELSELIVYALQKAGAVKLMTPELIATLADHAQGNPRALMNIAGELLSAAAQREARHIDEKLFLELCAAPPVPEAKTARQRR